MNNNIVSISGELISDFEFDHDCHNVAMHKAYVSIKRDSGIEDIVPVIAPEDIARKHAAGFVNVCGDFRSFNHYCDNGRRCVILNIFAQDVKQCAEDYQNHIVLDGIIVKSPSLRFTPIGRTISDFVLAVKRPYCGTDYIPCIAWGNTAYNIQKCAIGTQAKLHGRIQSRIYAKDGQSKTAYEVSVSDMVT